MDYTPILKLSLPPFDSVPWDEAVNNDFSILDAAVGRFFGVANLVGVWKNSTAYTSGQSVVDDSDSSMWTCAIAHTSAAAPTTFGQDRGTNPGFWTNIASTARDYAQQAATSAANAANSAAAAATSASQAANSAAVVAGALPLSGGTMTGPLVLSADPTNVLGAATKQYVDARVGGTGYLPTTGGTMTGALTLSGAPSANLHAATKQYVDTQDALRLALTGGTLTGQLTVGGNGIQYALGTGHYYSFNWTGTRLQALVDGSNVGNVAFGDFLPLAGGSLSGALTAPSYSTTFSGYWSADANYVYFDYDGSNWRWQYTRSTGALGYVRGSDGAYLFSIDQSGNAGVSGTIGAAGITSTGAIVMNQQGVNALWAADASNVYMRFSNSWGWTWSRSTGRLFFLNGSGTPLYEFNEAGYGLMCAQIDGNYYANSWDGYGVSLWVNNTNEGYAVRSLSGSGLTNVYQIGLNGGNSTVYAYYPPGVAVQWNYSPSDARLKTNIAEPSLDALETINQLKVHQFDMTVPIPDAVEQHWDFGLIAQEVGAVLPIAHVSAPENGYDTLRELPLLATLVRAVQQLSQQVTALGPK